MMRPFDDYQRQAVKHALDDGDFTHIRPALPKIKDPVVFEHLLERAIRDSKYDIARAILQEPGKHITFDMLLRNLCGERIRGGENIVPVLKDIIAHDSWHTRLSTEYAHAEDGDTEIDQRFYQAAHDLGCFTMIHGTDDDLADYTRKLAATPFLKDSHIPQALAEKIAADLPSHIAVRKAKVLHAAFNHTRNDVRESLANTRARSGDAVFGIADAFGIDLCTLGLAAFFAGGRYTAYSPVLQCAIENRSERALSEMLCALVAQPRFKRCPTYPRVIDGLAEKGYLDALAVLAPLHNHALTPSQNLMTAITRDTDAIKTLTSAGLSLNACLQTAWTRSDPALFTSLLDNGVPLSAAAPLVARAADDRFLTDAQKTMCAAYDTRQRAESRKTLDRWRKPAPRKAGPR